MSNEDWDWKDLGYAPWFLLVGIGYTVLPFAAWPNSILFAILFSPGLLLGPLLAFLGLNACLQVLRSKVLRSGRGGNG